MYLCDTTVYLTSALVCNFNQFIFESTKTHYILHVGHMICQ